MKNVDHKEMRLHQEAYLAILREDINNRPENRRRERSRQRQQELRERRIRRQNELARLAARTADYGTLPDYEMTPVETVLPAWLEIVRHLGKNHSKLHEYREEVQVREAQQARAKDKLQQRQKLVARLDPEIARLQTALAVEQGARGAEFVQQALEEFGIILSIQDVTGFTYGEDEEFHLFVSPRVEHRERWYDLGDWEIIFGRSDRRQPTMVCTRSGALPSYRQKTQRVTAYYYPDRKYERDWAENQYCLNGRRETVVRYMQGGNWLEMLLTACEAVRSLEGYEIDTYGRSIPEVFTELGPAKPEAAPAAPKVPLEKVLGRLVVREEVKAIKPQFNLNDNLKRIQPHENRNNYLEEVPVKRSRFRRKKEH